jgi:hypothetical protein
VRKIGDTPNIQVASGSHAAGDHNMGSNAEPQRDSDASILAPPEPSKVLVCVGARGHVVSGTRRHFLEASNTHAQCDESIDDGRRVSRGTYRLRDNVDQLVTIDGDRPPICERCSGDRAQRQREAADAKRARTGKPSRRQRREDRIERERLLMEAARRGEICGPTPLH